MLYRGTGAGVDCGLQAVSQMYWLLTHYCLPGKYYFPFPAVEHHDHASASTKYANWQCV